MEPPRLNFPDTGTFLLHNAFVPECCLLLQQQNVEGEDGGEVAVGSLGGGGRGQGGGGEQEGQRPSTPSPPLPPLLRSSSSYPDLDSLAHVDIEVVDGVITEVCRARPRGGVGDNARGDGVVSASSSSSTSSSRRDPRPIVDAGCGIVFPCFVDLHTHIGGSISESWRGLC